MGNENDGKIALTILNNDLEVRGDFFPPLEGGTPITPGYISELLEKSNDLIEINKVKNEIRGENSKIQKLYLEIGKQAYAVNEAGGDFASLLPLMDQINEYKEKIEALNDKIERIKVETGIVIDDSADDMDEVIDEVDDE